MKNSIYSTTLLALIAIISLGSCARTKTSKSASAKNTTTQTTQVTKGKDTPNSSKSQDVEVTTKVVTKEKVVTETTVTVTENPEKTEKVATPITPTPPQTVASIFKKEYPNASATVWNDVVTEGKNGKMYLVSFLLNNNRNSAIFNEKGVEVERRSEILPVQLPQNIYDAIKHKYKDAEIISASTFHSTLSKGNYAAKVKSEEFAIVSEFILNEKGEFIEQ